MSKDAVSPSASMRDSAFAGLASATLGLVMWETGSLFLDVRPLGHVFNILIGTVLISILLRRFLRYWPASATAPTGPGHSTQRRGPIIIRVLSAAAIGSASYFASDALADGFVSPFMFFAFGLVYLPWSRLAKTRRHCLGYWLVCAFGIGTGLSVRYPWFHPMFLLGASWLLWTFALVAWARIILDERQKQRHRAGGTGAQPYCANADPGDAQPLDADTEKLPLAKPYNMPT